MMTRRQLGFEKSGNGLGDTPSDTAQPDQLDAAGVLALQGGQAGGPGLSPGINLSPGAVAADVAGGIPFTTQVAGILGVSGSTAGTIVSVAGIGLAVLVAAAVFGGKRRR